MSILHSALLKAYSYCNHFPSLLENCIWKYFPQSDRSNAKLLRNVGYEYFPLYISMATHYFQPLKTTTTTKKLASIRITGTPHPPSVMSGWLQHCNGMVNVNLHILMLIYSHQIVSYSAFCSCVCWGFFNQRFWLF